MADAADNATIIVKKVVKGGAAHHGGAWKVAYADFVTAMMAFFLLLWLLNVTTSEERRGIADYFSPTAVSRSTSGSGQILGGQSLAEQGSKKSELSPPIVTFTLSPPKPETEGDEEEPQEQKAAKAAITEGVDEPETAEDLTEETVETPVDMAENEPSDAEGESMDPEIELADAEGEPSDTEREPANAEIEPSETESPTEPTEAEIERELVKREQERFEQAERELRQAIQEVPEMAGLVRNLIIDNTPEGMRIQIVDQDRKSMFPIGSADMNDQMRQLIDKITEVVRRVPNRIAITGHTDSTPYRSGNAYGNWELSADRANASRRALLQAGLSPARIAYVTGKAETEPLIPEKPELAANRRISIVLLREAGERKFGGPR